MVAKKTSGGKKRSLSTADKYYVEQNRHLTTEQLAIDIGCTDRQIQKLVATLPPVEEPTSNTPATAEIKGRTMTHDSFGRNEKYGVVLMTPGAAQQSDDGAKQARKNAKKSYSSFTQKIR